MRIEVNETLARMLATENLHIRYSATAKTANFQVKTRLLTLPLYSRLEQIVHLLLAAHEAFHALWTTMDRDKAAAMIDRDPKNRGRAARYVNICEDVRIENLGKELYPGIREVFRNGYKIMTDAGFFGDLTNVDQFSLIDRVNIYFKAGAHVNVSFSEIETPYVQAVNKARSFDEMIVACRALYEFAKNQQQPEDEPDQDEDDQDKEQDQKPSKSKSKSKKKQNKEQDETEQDDEESSDEGEESDESEESDGDAGDDSDADGEESNEESDSDADSEESDEDGDESESGEGDESDEDGDAGDESDEDGDSDADSEGDEDSDADADEDGDSDTDSSKPQDKTPEEGSTQDQFDRHLADHCDPVDDFNYVTLPKVKMKAAVVDYTVVMKELTDECAKASVPSGSRTKPRYTPKPDWFAGIQRALEPDVMFMVQQFLMMRRADQAARTRTSATGDVDMNKLWAHRITDNIFATTETVPDDKNHGLVMVVDWSGSMADPLFDVLVQLLSLMMFCRKAAIPFEVFIFINRDSVEGNSFIPAMDSVSTNGSTRLYNLFSSRMPQAHFYQMCLMIFSSFQGRKFTPPLEYLDPNKYGTPLGEAMLIASDFVPIFQKQNRLQFVHTIFLTDGDGNSSMTVRANQLEDQNTRRTYGPVDGANTIEVLHLLPRIVRDRTRAKMIGFYVGSPTARMLTDSKMTSKTAQNLLATEGFMSVTGTNYDAFYVLNPAMSVPETPKPDVDPTAQILMRRKSRVMLQRFIKMIA